MKVFSEARKMLKSNSTDNMVIFSHGADKESIQTAIMLKEADIADSTIIGDEEIIENLLTELNSPYTFNIVHSDSPEKSAQLAVNLIREGIGNVLIKGHLQTGTLLKSVLNKESGIRDSELLTHISMLEIPGHHKVLGVMDGALNIEPTLKQKEHIINNGVSFFRKFDYDKPKVAIVEANEVVNQKIPSSIEAEKLMRLQQKGEIKNCVIDGPISVDIALDPESAKAKGYESEVAGDADIILGPNIGLVNSFAKAIMVFTNARVSGVIIGAKCPIVNISRSSTADEKFDSTILALVASQKD